MEGSNWLWGYMGNGKNVQYPSMILIVYFWLQLLIQEILVGVTEVNSAWYTVWGETAHRPDRSWVRRYAARHNLVLRFLWLKIKNILHWIARATSEISKGRQVISPEDLERWQQDTWTYLSSKLELLEALQDPDRLWNQDETSVELGCEKQVDIIMNKFKI